MSVILPELLAPAGGRTQLVAALEAGANAVYAGVGRFNMRAGGANNFTVPELVDACARCHDYGAKLHLALNTIVFEGERKDVFRLLDAVAGHVDAVIASDWDVIQGCKRREIPLHASTQMSCSNSGSAKFLASQGFERIVLARECSMAEVTEIAKVMRPLGVGIEVFAHGAQCVAESGRCFLSQQAYGASACRGECQQPCRRPFRIVEEVSDGCGPRPLASYSVGAHAIFSARDLCSLPFLPQFVESGVCSLKIEGRARPAEYVSTVVRAYRDGLDAIAAGTYDDALAAALLKRVETVYHRPFGVGLFHGRPGADQFQGGAKENLAREVKYSAGVVRHDYPRAGFVEILLQAREVRVGDTLRVQGPRTGDVSFKVEGIRRDDAVLDVAEQGNWFTCARPVPLRPGDRVYLVKTVR